MSDDKNFYDDNLSTDILIFVDLKEEAFDAIAEIQLMTEEMVAIQEGDAEQIKKAVKKQLIIPRLKKVAYNVKAELETFVEEMVRDNAIKKMMILIEESRSELEIINISCQILASLFQYDAAIRNISKKAQKYFEAFFEFSSLNQIIKKQCIRIFLNISQKNMPNLFDKIDKAAVNYARDST